MGGRGIIGLREKVAEYLGDAGTVPAEHIGPNAKLSTDLGLKSADLRGVRKRLIERFRVALPQDCTRDWRKVQDIVTSVEIALPLADAPTTPAKRRPNSSIAIPPLPSGPLTLDARLRAKALIRELHTISPALREAGVHAELLGRLHVDCWALAGALHAAMNPPDGSNHNQGDRA